MLLVVTAIEDTWGDSDEILFLGEWCKHYERRDVWGTRNYQTLEFHWDDRKKLDKDFKYLDSLHKKILECLVQTLNSFHRSNHSLRYWQIIIDPWLMSYVAVLFDRWENIRLAFEKYEELEVVFCDCKTVAPSFSYEEYQEQILTDEWNQNIYQTIIELEYLKRSHIRYEGGTADCKNRYRENYKLNKSFPRRLWRLLGKYWWKFRSTHKIFFLNPYFNSKAMKKLAASLGEKYPKIAYPMVFDDSLVDISKYQSSLPNRDKLEISFDPQSNFESFLKSQIIRDLPYAFLEGYAFLRDKTREIPINARAIVTANDHWGNVFAKAWFAEQINQGVKLVILEHGGSLAPYGTLFNFEEDMSDFKGIWYLPYHPKHRQVPPNKLLERYNLSSDQIRSLGSRTYCSVIGSEQARYVIRAHFYPMAAECLASYDLVIDLHQRLNQEVKDAFRIKPYHCNIGWNTWQRYTDYFGTEKIYPSKKMDDVFRVSRLIICTYPETTFAEAMVSGFPTVLIYPDQFNQMHPISNPLIEKLRLSKIIFHDASLAAEHINNIWSDPDEWWRSPEIIEARQEFKRHAADMDGDWIKKWKVFLQDEVLASTHS